MKKDRYLIVVFFLIQNIIHNMGHPVTPDFVKSLGIADYMFGVFFATMSFGLMIGGPIWGTLGDRGKKKLYIVIGLLLYSIGQFFFGYSNNQYLMIFFRFLSGFGVVASITLFTSQLIEITDLKDRARFLAYIAAAVTLGASIGYFLGGFIAENSVTQDLFNITNKKEIFLIQAILNLIYVGFILFTFYDRKCALPIKNKNTIFDSFKSIKNIDLRLFIFLIALAFITMGAINLNKFIDVYFNDQNLDSLQLGTFKMVTGYVTLVASIILVPIFAKFRKQIGFMLLLQVLSAAIVFYTFRASDFIKTVYSIYLIYILIKAIFTPLEQSYISNHVKDGEYGKIMGIRQSFISIGMVVGPLLGGFLYERNPLLLFDSSAYAFIIGFLLLIIVIIFNKKEILSSKNN